MTYTSSCTCTVTEQPDGFDSSTDLMYLDKKSNWKRKTPADIVIWRRFSLVVAIRNIAGIGHGTTGPAVNATLVLKFGATQQLPEGSEAEGDVSHPIRFL